MGEYKYFKKIFNLHQEYEKFKNENKNYKEISCERIKDGSEYKCFKKVLDPPQKADKKIKDFIDSYSNDDFKVGLQSFRLKKYCHTTNSYLPNDVDYKFSIIYFDLDYMKSTKLSILQKMKIHYTLLEWLNDPKQQVCKRYCLSKSGNIIPLMFREGVKDKTFAELKNKFLYYDFTEPEFDSVFDIITDEDKHAQSVAQKRFIEDYIVIDGNNDWVIDTANPLINKSPLFYFILVQS